MSLCDLIIEIHHCKYSCNSSSTLTPSVLTELLILSFNLCIILQQQSVVVVQLLHAIDQLSSRLPISVLSSFLEFCKALHTLNTNLTFDMVAIIIRLQS